MLHTEAAVLLASDLHLVQQPPAKPATGEERQSRPFRRDTLCSSQSFHLQGQFKHMATPHTSCD